MLASLPRNQQHRWNNHAACSPRSDLTPVGLILKIEDPDISDHHVVCNAKATGGLSSSPSPVVLWLGPRSPNTLTLLIPLRGLPPGTTFLVLWYWRMQWSVPGGLWLQFCPHGSSQWLPLQLEDPGKQVVGVHLPYLLQI